MLQAPDHRLLSTVVLACLLLVSADVLSQDTRTVIGPTNPELQYGADALLAGDAQEGVRLTLAGLKQAGSARERHTAWSNLCAGYVMLEQYQTALEYCNQVLEENDRHWRAYSNRALVNIKLQRYAAAEQDLQHGESLAPNSRTLQAVRAMLLDAVEPVAPSIVIDDRRQPAADEKND
ncbi:MAG: hypothetical protein OEO82_00865 [Gammaproteobacteria bacterium]|nr:hypothetical protein [Gammaproteobacteria bacterium]